MSFRGTLEGLLQLRLRVGEGVALNELFELAPRPVIEQRAQRRVIRLDEISRARIELREQRGQVRRRSRETGQGSPVVSSWSALAVQGGG